MSTRKTLLGMKGLRMFNKGMKIGENQKYDTTQVSSEGVTKEERAALEKKNLKMIDIYKAFDTDGSGDLNKLELAKAMDAFEKLDADGDGKLSKKEREEGAKQFNEMFGTKISGKDIKSFIKGVLKVGKGDEKESTKGIIANDEAAKNLANLKAKPAEEDFNAKFKAQGELSDVKAEAKAKAEAEAKAKAEAEAKAKAKAEAEAKAKAKAEAEAKAKAEAEAKAKAEAEKKAEEAKQKRIDEAKQKAIDSMGSYEDRVKAAREKAYKLANMNRHPICEKLENGYTRRDVPGSSDHYFDQSGNRISEADYKKARGPKSKLIDNMVKSPILEQLSNGYTKRNVPGTTDFYYDKEGNRITKEAYEAAKKA